MQALTRAFLLYSTHKYAHIVSLTCTKFSETSEYPLFAKINIVLANNRPLTDFRSFRKSLKLMCQIAKICTRKIIVGLTMIAQ